MRGICFLLIIICSLSFLTAESGKRVTIAVDSSPYYTQSEIERQGLLRLIYEEAFAAMGYEAEITAFPVQRGISMLFNNQVDAYSPGTLYITGKQRERILWETSGYVIPVYVNYKPSGVKLSDIPSAGIGERITYFSGNRVSLTMIRSNPVLDLMVNGGVEVYAVENEEQQLKMLRAGRIDLVQNDYQIAYLALKKLFPDEIDNFGFFLIPPWEISLAFSRENPRCEELYEIFKEGLSILKESGRWQSFTGQAHSENQNLFSSCLLP